MLGLWCWHGVKAMARVRVYTRVRVQAGVSIQAGVMLGQGTGFTLGVDSWQRLGIMRF